jgi:hypothetical protein
MHCGMFPIFKGNTDHQIAEGDNTASDECEAVVINCLDLTAE